MFSSASSISGPTIASTSSFHGPGQPRASNSSAPPLESLSRFTPLTVNQAYSQRGAKAPLTIEEGRSMMETIGTVLDRIEAQQAMSLQLKPDAISLDLLQAIYRNSSLPLTVRLKAAIAALPHEVPKLMATAIINENSFAEILDRRLKRIAEEKVIEARPTNAEKVDIRLPPPIPDRRFRRI